MRCVGQLPSLSPDTSACVQSCEGWLLGVPVGKKKKTIVTRFVQLKGAGTSWNLLMYQDEASSSGKTLRSHCVHLMLHLTL